MITDPTNSLYPDDAPHHRRNYAGDPTRVPSDMPWSRPDADILGDIRRVTVTHDGPRYMDAIERAVRRQLLGVDGIAGLDVDDDTREWEAIDPRRRQAIANWTMTDRGRSGLLGKGDYPPGALVRNPPGFYTPEAHP